MTLAAFLELVEARTKLASILPCAVGVLFAAAYFDQLNALNTGLFFVAMLLFDMTTTAINNLMDYQKAQSPTYRDQTNVIGRMQLAPATVRRLIVSMLTVASLLGLVLVWRTQWLLLVLGGACFVVGIFYTFGPLPLSRFPLGEVFSGVVMGLGIPVIAAFVNVSNGALIQARWAWPELVIAGNWNALLTLGLVCVTPMATIANVMLANNLSDLAEDLANHRHTLPMYLGRRWSLWLYQGLAYVGYAALLLAVGFGLLGWPVLAAFGSLPWVIANTRRFVRRQDKRLTFHTAIKTLVAANGGLILGLALDWGWQVW
ncbi:1,4-dihydroxy-2-naphthoate polyprenyltransferase [Lacticaseibacillus baoqingensis]|uniref:1,4-dihydroxy-2-naphthoate polyprenyltransferase n=1 Tax=Lacticaseibacillus baoqingensis TaxID=2486013 RepID=A0ABW4ECK4_9LACO|nr:1,4-dihydroxy-2-naphthoate polyprenyltransferase [Lacticaseibacillus baoqingensis]